MARQKKTILLANSPISKTLRPCREESVNFDSTGNLYIEGDNLDVLKLLQNNYLNKVKMIYIDPPYNTGNDFVYEDDFAISSEEYLQRSGDVDEDNNRLFTNTDSNGRFHTDWLNMIYPRLKLAKDLLTDDGVIFISIDDNEITNLRKICDEVFGAGNFIATIVWKHTQQSKNDERHFSRQFNYNIVYAKDISLTEDFYFERTDEDNINYSNIDNDPKGLWRSGDVRSPNYRRTLCYDVITPNGNIIKAPENGWRWSEDTLKDKIAKGEIIFKPNQDGIIRKIYLCEQKGRTPENLWDKDIYGTTRIAAATIKDLFNNIQVFDTPKPYQLVKKFMELFDTKNYYTLDFFSGSATTAHAVMQLNAEDGGNRKFIMVQLQEETPENSEAYKAGYKNICEIGKERIRRAGRKIADENRMTAPNLDIGFRVLKLDSSNMNDVYYKPQETEQNFLTKTADNIKQERSSEDLLFQALLEMDTTLDMSIKSQKIDGQTIYIVGANSVVACFEDDITEETIKTICALKPTYAVFRDSSFATDDAKINCSQYFKRLSSNTIIKVI